MKIFLSLLTFICICFGDVFEDGIKAFESSNYTKAYELFKTPAEQGNANAQYNLGVMYYSGEGVKQNYKKAKELFGIACDGGFQSGCKNYKILNQQGY